MSENIENIAWSIRVPIFRNSIILRQMSIAIGIPFGLLIILLIIAKAIYVLVFFAALFFIAFLFIVVVLGGKYDVDFELNKTGIYSFTRKKQVEKKLINTTTDVLGLFLGRLGISSAVLLTQSRHNTAIKWSSVRKVRFLPEKYLIMIRSGFADNIALFCTLENYSVVESLIKTNLKDENAIYSIKGCNRNYKL